MKEYKYGFIRMTPELLAKVLSDAGFITKDSRIIDINTDNRPVKTTHHDYMVRTLKKNEGKNQGINIIVTTDKGYETANDSAFALLYPEVLHGDT